MKFFNVDLHISVIADIKNIFNGLGHQIDNEYISDHSWVFKKEKTDQPILKNWQNIDDDLCDLFYKTYKDKLEKYDGFVVTHTPVFSKLYEKFNKPIICVASTRYEFPYTFNKDKWENLNYYLTNNKNIIKISNNLFDKYYCETLAGGEWKYIPSLCEYTEAKYNKKNDRVVLFSKNKKINGLVNKELLGRYKWEELFNNKAIVHIPYNYSTMSIFEQYTANVPLLFPSKEYLTSLFLNKEAMTEISYLQVFNKKPEDLLQAFYNPNLYNNLQIFLDNLDYADFYNLEWMPYIEYFSSEKELQEKTTSLNFDIISKNMQQKNEERKNKIYSLWSEILKDIK
jgi:hypothetical protein